MKKKATIALLFLLVAASLSSCAQGSVHDDGQDFYSFELLGTASQPKEFQTAVWISYIDYKPMLTGKTAEQYSDNLDIMFDNLISIGTNTIYFQVRPFSDSLYPSEYYPKSYLVSGDFSEDFEFDPFKILLEKAKQNGVEVYAWINPYRLSSGNYGNPDLTAYFTEKNLAMTSGSLIMLDPASDEVIELIVNGAREVCENYDIAGVIFDDYYYPADFSVDAESYKQSGSSESQAQWRRNNVSELIRRMYDAVHGAGKLFGISPAGVIARNRDSYGLDVELFCRERGYIDFISPQIYYGFENQSMAFLSALKAWGALVEDTEIDCVVSLAAYKAGSYDRYAGSGDGEWQTNFDILSRQYAEISGNQCFAGMALFRYGSLFAPNESVSTFAVLERENLKQSILGG